MKWHQLVHCFPVFLDGSTIFCASFIVEDFEVDFVAAFLDAPADIVVGGKAVAVMIGAEIFN